MTIREGEPIEFDTTGLTYDEVHNDPDVFLRRLMSLLTKGISGLTLDKFVELLEEYNSQDLRIDPFLDLHLGKVCPHCGHKHKEEER